MGNVALDRDVSTGWLTTPTRCPVCRRCRMFIEGARRGRCVYEGPYKGYVDAQTGREIFIDDPYLGYLE